MSFSILNKKSSIHPSDTIKYDIYKQNWLLRRSLLLVPTAASGIHFTCYVIESI
jgi:hypothetical protein